MHSDAICMIYVSNTACTGDDSYSARLYKAKERKTVIFCMCLSQPEYIKVINSLQSIYSSFCSLFRGVTQQSLLSTELMKREETLMFWMK